MGEQLSKKVFKDKMIELGVIYNRDISKSVLEVYYEYLKHFSDNFFTRIVKKIIYTEKFFPLISVFIESSKDMNPKRVTFTVAEEDRQTCYHK